MGSVRGTLILLIGTLKTECMSERCTLHVLLVLRMHHNCGFQAASTKSILQLINRSSARLKTIAGNFYRETKLSPQHKSCNCADTLIKLRRHHHYLIPAKCFVFLVHFFSRINGKNYLTYQIYQICLHR